MPAPTIESHNHSISSGGTTATIAVTAAGAGRVIIVCATIGGNTGLLPTATIASADPNIGAWFSIGHLPVTFATGILIQAWYAITSGVVSAATVTVTVPSVIDDAALAYITAAAANTTQPLDQNGALATGGSNVGSSARDYNAVAHSLYATISTATANILVVTLIGTNANRTYATPTAGTTLTETVLNGGGVRFAAIGVYTAPFTALQSGTNVGSTDSQADPLFAFGITADTQGGGGGGTTQARAMVLA